MPAGIALTTMCSESNCRRRQNISADRIWHVDVRQGPGSVRMAGWRCAFCGTDNTTPLKHLPKAIAQILPSKGQAMARLAETAPIASQHAMLSGSPSPMVVQIPARQAPAAQKPSTSVTQVTIPAAKQATGRGMATQPATTIAAAAPPAQTLEQRIRGNAPQWHQGDRAREVLAEALARIAANGGDALAMSSSTGRFEPVEIHLPSAPFKSEQDKRAFTGQILDELDDLRADILMLGGSVEGRPWQAVLHFTAGAASFV